MAKRRKRARYEVTPERFVVAWNTAATVEEAAENLGMPGPLVIARAAKYRSAGVELKKMRRGPKPKLDVEALNRLLAEVGDGPVRPRRGTGSKKRG